MLAKHYAKEKMASGTKTDIGKEQRGFTAIPQEEKTVETDKLPKMDMWWNESGENLHLNKRLR